MAFGPSQARKSLALTVHLNKKNEMKGLIHAMHCDGPHQQVHVNGEILHQKWKQFADLAGVLKDEWLILSERWLIAFKKCCGLKEFKKHGEAGSSTAEDVKKEHVCLQELIIKYKYWLKDIFDMDETGLLHAWVICSWFLMTWILKLSYCRMPPDHGLMDKSSSGTKGNKKWLTYVFTVLHLLLGRQLNLEHSIPEEVQCSTWVLLP